MATQKRQPTDPRSWPELEAVRRVVAGDPFWEVYLDGAPRGSSAPRSIHLAVFVEPFLGYVLDGSKTVESRFSATRQPPYGRVHEGDVVLLKRAGGPVVGLARVKAVWSYRLDPNSWRTIRESFSEALRAQDPEFWERRRGASYATLMLLDRVRPIEPVRWKKADRRGWVVLGSRPQLFLF